MTNDQINETVDAVLAQIDDEITVDDHLNIAVALEEAANRQFAQAESLEWQRATA